MNEAFHILMIDDDKRYQHVYQTMLTENLAATVSFATSGEEALLQLDEVPAPDLVILDLDLPGIQGDDVLKKINSDSRTQHTPIIVLTGTHTMDQHMKIIEMGADDFIEKGAPPEIIMARVKAQMRHKIAIDRLGRLAADRDLFAASVLEDIAAARWNIVTTLAKTRTLVNEDIAGNKREIMQLLETLCEHGSHLGTFASDVIQSVRDTRREANIAPQNLTAMLSQINKIYRSAEDKQGETISWHLETPLKPVLADRSFLRLALLTAAQSAVKAAEAAAAIDLKVTQESVPTPTGDSLGRPRLITRIYIPMQPSQMARLNSHADLQAQMASGTSQSPLGIGLSLIAKVMAKMGGRAFVELAENKSSLVIGFELEEAAAAQT